MRAARGSLAIARRNDTGNSRALHTAGRYQLFHGHVRAPFPSGSAGASPSLNLARRVTAEPGHPNVSAGRITGSAGPIHPNPSAGQVIGSAGPTPPNPPFERGGKRGDWATFDAGTMLGPLGWLEPGSSPARDALRDGRYPWYDPEADRVQPVWPQQFKWLKSLGKRLEWIGEAIDRFFRRFHFRGLRGGGAGGESLGTLVLVAVLVAFFVFLIVLAIHLGPGAAHRREERARLGTRARLADLPDGIRTDGGDPWAEAMRRKAAGDLAGAVICLFAHQLLSLDRLGLIRLVPGLTGRQYLRGLRDPELADCVGPTLSLFEWVYYGRRTPTAAAFDDVWRRALVFEARTNAPEAVP
jgi:hypothetical protein